MDEKQYRENQTGYDQDTFGETGTQGGKWSGTQETYNQNVYGQDGQYNQQDGGSFYHSSSKPSGNEFGIASMVLGILALVFFCGCFNIPLAILSIVFAIIHISRKTGSNGFAVAGIVTSVISVILTIVMVVGLFAYGAFSGAKGRMYVDTLPFEYFMDGDDFYDYYDGDDSYDFYGDEDHSYIDYFDHGPYHWHDL